MRTLLLTPWIRLTGVWIAAAAPCTPAAASGATESSPTTFTVKRSTWSGGPYTVIASGLTTPGYSDTGLINGTTYYYVVSAVSAAGEGPHSMQVAATPTAGPTPTPPPAHSPIPAPATAGGGGAHSFFLLLSLGFLALFRSHRQANP